MMFDWITFNPERFKVPSVIAGIVLAVAGLVIALAAGPVSEAVDSRRREKGKEPGKTALIMRISGLVLVLTGTLLAVFTA